MQQSNEKKESPAGAEGEPKGGQVRRSIPWSVLGSRSFLGGLAVCSIALNIFGYGLIVQRLGHPVGPPPSPEIELGTFQFRSHRSGASDAASARFKIHATLIKEFEPSGRLQLAATQHQVREAVEELLRAVHGADFEDPALAELKRQLQEKINQALGIRMVSTVIITDLALHLAPSEAHSPPTAAKSPTDHAPPEPETPAAAEHAPPTAEHDVAG